MTTLLTAMAPLPPNGEPRSPDAGFFAYHGVWAPGVRLFRQLHFGAKAIIISLAFAVPMLGLLGWQIKMQADQGMQARMDATRQHVEIAAGVLAWAQAQEASGQLSREQAQTMAKRVVSQMRYDASEYFWINDMTPSMVMHAVKPDLDGKDLSGMKDPNGLHLFKTFVAKVQAAGKGFVDYQWPRPGSELPVDKVSYVQGFAPWGWVIGSGVYVDDLNAAVRAQIGVLAVVVVAALLMVAYLFLSFYRVMDGGLKETRRHLRAMTEGDLTTSPSPWGEDDAAQLMHELRAMQVALRGMVTRVRQSSEGILTSSSEIASGAMDLSSRTEQAAANLQESAASMEQIAATVKATFAHTAEATQMAHHNAELAAEGGRIMGEVIANMDTIKQSSARIGDIIGTIDSIAFQTNILALNAAVEAARAGEQGRGFAVVASEVRTLAQRSATAAREIKSLIGTSLEQVNSGTQVVRRAGTTIADIVTASQHVNQLLDQVITGAREQTTGIGQIGQAVHELDHMTQQNAALVEQSAAAASSMNDQARHLAEEVANFRLHQAA